MIGNIRSNVLQCTSKVCTTFQTRSCRDSPEICTCFSISLTLAALLRKHCYFNKPSYLHQRWSLSSQRWNLLLAAGNLGLQGLRRFSSLQLGKDPWFAWFASFVCHRFSGLVLSCMICPYRCMFYFWIFIAGVLNLVLCSTLQALRKRLHVSKWACQCNTKIWSCDNNARWWNMVNMVIQNIINCGFLAQVHGARTENSTLLFFCREIVLVQFVHTHISMPHMHVQIGENKNVLKRRSDSQYANKSKSTQGKSKHSLKVTWFVNLFRVKCLRTWPNLICLLLLQCGDPENLRIDLKNSEHSF